MTKKALSHHDDATGSLFDTPSGWHSDPMEAFTAFVRSERFVKTGAGAQLSRRNGHPTRDSSVRVYRAMFGKVLAHLQDRQTDLLHATPADIRSFFERGSPLTDTTRWRYLRLLERVYHYLHDEMDLVGELNPAAAVAVTVATRPESMARARRERATVCIDASAQARMVSVIELLRREGEHPGVAAWKRERDAAMVAAMLGAGLKVAEIVGLNADRVSRPEPDGSVTIEVPPAAAEGTVRWHRTRLAPFAVEPVQKWIERRARLGIAGQLLFPSDKAGRPMDKATVYRRTRAAFERAGVEALHRGGRTLRNSFAARELVEGGQPDLVGEMLGHRERRSIERYRRAAARLAPQPEASAPTAAGKAIHPAASQAGKP